MNFLLLSLTPYSLFSSPPHIAHSILFPLEMEDSFHLLLSKALWAHAAMSPRSVQRIQSEGSSRSFLSRFRSVSVFELVVVVFCFVGLAESAGWKYASGEEEGDKVVLKLDQGQKEVGLAAGGLHGYYILDSIHFHWGGSEHTFNGQRLAMEVHLVHYNAAYESLDEAKDAARGLAVIAVIIHETPDDNPVLDPLVASLGDAIDDPGESMGLPTLFSPLTLLPANRSLFFRYTGSLTTPPCSESVEWTVLYRTVAASQRQLEKFKTLNSEEGSDIEYNYRRTQPHHDRKILFVQSSQYQSIYEEESSGAKGAGIIGHYGLYLSAWTLVYAQRHWD